MATIFTLPGSHFSSASVNRLHEPIMAQPSMSGLAVCTSSILAAASCGVSLL